MVYILLVYARFEYSNAERDASRLRSVYDE